MKKDRIKTKQENKNEKPLDDGTKLPPVVETDPNKDQTEEEETPVVEEEKDVTYYTYVTNNNGVVVLLKNNSEKLKTIDLSNVITIERNAFMECESLESVNLNSCVDLLGGAFYDCRLLKEIQLFKNNLNITLSIPFS